MIQTKPVGRNAPAMKYDILTALGAHALAAGRDKALQKSCLRLLTLVTARYNWRSGELTVGRPEMARLWCVDERTVKRELARLKALGWIEVRRPGARGRLTAYGLCFERILETTQPAWDNVGADYVARMSAGQGEEPGDGKVVAFPGKSMPQAPDPSSGDEWALASGLLFSENPGEHASWFAPLRRVQRIGDRLLLRAPSRFHANYVQTHLADHILAAVNRVDESIGVVAVVHD